MMNRALQTTQSTTSAVYSRITVRVVIQGLLLISLLFTAQVNAEVRLIAAVDEGPVGQPFELIIEAAQLRSITGSPDLTPLKQDFNILSSRSVYLTEKRNGRTVHVSRWTLSLSPLRPGSLSIPAVQVRNEWSQPLTFQAHPRPGPKSEPLQLQTSLSQTQAYLGRPLTLSVQLLYNIALQSAELTQPQIDGVRILRKGEQQVHSQVLNQQRYQVIEQQYWIQPLKPGRFQIPSLQFNATDTLGNPINGQSQPLEFTISALPDNVSGQIQLLTTQVELQQQWQNPVGTPRAGDTLIRTISLQAQGIPSLWLPDIELPPIQGVSVYPQPARLEQIDQDGVLISRKQIDFKLLLTQPGTVDIPGVEIVWWDVDNSRAITAKLASSSLQVAAFSAQTEPESEPPATTQKAPEPSAATLSATLAATTDENASVQWQAWIWALIALVCAGGWTLSQQRNKKLEAELTQFGSRKAGRSTTRATTEPTLSATAPSAVSTISPSTGPTTAPATAPPPLARELHNSFDQLAEACHLNDPELAYQRLIDWASVHWPHTAIESLEDIQHLAKDPTLTYLLRNLEHQLQDPSDSWHGDLMLERIERLRQKSRRQTLKPRPQAWPQSRSQATSQARPLSGQPSPAIDSSRSDQPVQRKPFRTTIGD